MAVHINLQRSTGTDFCQKHKAQILPKLILIPFTRGDDLSEISFGDPLLPQPGPL